MERGGGFLMAPIRLRTSARAATWLMPIFTETPASRTSISVRPCK